MSDGSKKNGWFGKLFGKKQESSVNTVASDTSDTISKVDGLIWQLNKAFESNNEEMAQKILIYGLSNEELNEEEKERLLFPVIHHKQFSFYPSIHLFIRLFPDTLSTCVGAYVDFLLRTGREDEAAEIARDYVHRVHRAGLLAVEQSEAGQLNARQVEAFTLTLGASTMPYITLGARSYAERVMLLGKKLKGLEMSRSYFDKQIEMIREELKDAKNSEVNAMWEEFFSSGKNADRVSQACLALKLESLAVRFELQAKQVQVGAAIPFEKEFFMAVYKNEQGDAVLM
ncbi:MAG: hypothetical protein RBT63_00945 [Bdellovibrionales bacterium]|nr:hypothetical protein [Bdellovibrionales bacterium]